MREIDWFVVAFERPHAIGSKVEPLGRPGVVECALTREEFLQRLTSCSAPGAGRLGMYDFTTKRFRPTPEVPPELRFFYLCKPL